MPGPNSISVPLGITTMISFPRDNNNMPFHVKIWDKSNIVVATWLFPRREWYSLGSHVCRESVEWIRAWFFLCHLRLFSNSWRKEVFLPEACSIGEKTAPSESIFHEWIPTVISIWQQIPVFPNLQKKNSKGKFLIFNFPIIHFVQSDFLIAKESCNGNGNKVPAPKEEEEKFSRHFFFQLGLKINKTQKYSLELPPTVSNPYWGSCRNHKNLSTSLFLHSS